MVVEENSLHEIEVIILSVSPTHSAENALREEYVIYLPLQFPIEISGLLEVSRKNLGRARS